IQPSVTATHTFNVLDCAATSPAACITIPVCTTVAPVTTAPVTTAPVTTAPVTTVQPQPGFGAVIALIGLGAVALLVLRRH
ncbi:MAG: PGF-CTERM sorting domain-containing protein, partial [Methanomicrobiales archaeon]|nr:PGF-CTERM sorting domain-containing protein [Methanomicrobiales archaeon]